MRVCSVQIIIIPTSVAVAGYLVRCCSLLGTATCLLDISFGRVDAAGLQQTSMINELSDGASCRTDRRQLQLAVYNERSATKHI